jgi:nucleoside-diphosphate-sugar epimerase
MTLVAVTGGAGRIGRAVRDELSAHGYQSLCVDMAPARGMGADYRRSDLRELWQAMDALDGADMVVHLAAVGVPETHTRHALLAEQATFATNMLSTYNLFQAAVAHGIQRVVWASSETVLGPPFTLSDPDYLPIDDRHPVRPETSYALSKAMGEELARHVARQAGMTIVGLRFSVVMDEADYAALPRYWADPGQGRWNLWSYTDIRDVATSCRLALEADLSGAESLLISAPDTLMDRPTSELASEFLAGITLERPLGVHESLQHCGRAARLIGYRPGHAWRDHLGGRSDVL